MGFKLFIVAPRIAKDSLKDIIDVYFESMFLKVIIIKMYARCAPSLEAAEVRKRKEEFKLYISMGIKWGLVKL